MNLFDNFMTNAKFTRLLKKTGAAQIKYRQLLSEAQDEYVRRYGELPGDHDNDAWIDSLEGGCGAGDDSVSAELVDEWAVHAGRESYLSNTDISGREAAQPKEKNAE